MITINPVSKKPGAVQDALNKKDAPLPPLVNIPKESSFVRPLHGHPLRSQLPYLSQPISFADPRQPGGGMGGDATTKRLTRVFNDKETTTSIQLREETT
jgi:hypothetical protein